MEGATAPSTHPMTLTTDPPKVRTRAARAALSDEWAAANPRTPEEIHAFYVNAQHLDDDLEAFHTKPQRQEWTKTLVRMAQNTQAKLVVDIGSGAGHDLRALRDAGIWDVIGVEPNDILRSRCLADGLTIAADVASAPIESATITNCIDVLEHIPNPEPWLGAIADRAPVGALLLETCPVWDADTPLHLPANRGWAPGRCLQAHGWDKIASQDRMAVWKRFQTTPLHQTHIVVCASDHLSIHTHNSIIRLVQQDLPEFNWKPRDATESGLLLARSLWASKWYRETNADVFLMVDADMGFQPQDAMHLVQVAREKRSIVCGAYPTKDGSNLALRPLVDEGKLVFGPDEPPLQIRWGATGFMAVHRAVLDALIPTLPLCDADKPWSHWPIFHIDMLHNNAIVQTWMNRNIAVDQDWQRMGEDFGFCERARSLGFTVWMDPSIQLDHYNGNIAVNYMNMEKVRALKEFGAA